MIKTVSTSNSNFLKITNTAGTYISPYSGSSMNVSGAMRFNPHSQVLEVYDGNGWQNVVGHTDISFTEETIEILNWAKTQKDRMVRLERLAETNVTIRNCLDSVKKAEEALRIVEILSESSNQTGKDSQ